MRTAITYGLFPVTFVSAFAVAIIGLQQGITPEILLAGIVLSVAAIVAIGERLNPYVADWNESKNDTKTDFLHMIISMVLLKKGLETLFITVLFGAAIRVTDFLGFSLWPTQWPLLLQLPAAMLLVGFMEYWWHRMCHELPMLWRLHATHHSAPRLYWLNAGRFHPLDTLGSYTLTVGPLLILGAQPQLLLLVTLWVSVHGMFQHCNIHVRLGPLNYIFSMAELHRWHHSRSLEEANANYGNNIIFWDIVFGTMYYPKDRDAHTNIGLADMENFPEDYVGQLKSPFEWKKLEEGDKVGSTSEEREPLTQPLCDSSPQQSH